MPWKEHQKELFDAPEGVFTVLEFPKIIMSHASIWAALYQSDFVKKIKLIETRSASYQDFPFMCEVMSTASRISVCKECLVHWRIAAENNSTSQRGERCIVMAARSIDCIEILKKNGILDHCREEIYWHIFKANIVFFREILWKFKRQYFDELHRLFTPLAGEKTFHFKYFSRKKVAIVREIIAGNYNGAIRHVHYDWQSIRRTIFSFRAPWPSFFKGKYLRLIIFGLQIARS